MAEQTCCAVVALEDKETGVGTDLRGSEGD